MNERATTVCVLTGDIVKSTALPPDAREAVMAALASLAKTLDGWPSVGPVRYERFRGDGWQMLFGGTQWALRACLHVRASLRCACETSDTRIAVGLGDAHLAETLAASSGSAFERAGHALEELKIHRRWTIAGGFATPAEQAMARGLFAVCDALSRGWTARQADVFARLSGPAAPAMNEVAAALAVQPQTVQTHFARAGGHALLEAVEAFEQANSCEAS